jgi:very-short-patch-repair endonuclease
MHAQPSPPEALLWRALVNRKLGVSFRRQVPLAGYICDFVCASRKLVVEVDGAHHARRAAADARKDRALARLGYRVLRIEAKVVLRELAVAVELVRAALWGPACERALLHVVDARRFQELECDVGAALCHQKASYIDAQSPGAAIG